MQSVGRRSHLVNLDPAAEPTQYEFTVDIRDLISLEDVMEELEYGPNGGLVYCFEFLLQNMDWLDDEIGDYEDEYLIFDCPGQIELYTHIPVLPTIVRHLQKQLNMSLCVVYLLEAPFVTDRAKFFSGALSAMSAMMLLETPHINILSKMDLITNPGSTKIATSVSASGSKSNNTNINNNNNKLQSLSSGSSKNKINEFEGDYQEDNDYGDGDGDGTKNKSGIPESLTGPTELITKRDLKRFLNPDPLLLVEEANISMKNPKFHALNTAIAQLIDDFGMVQFLPLNSKDPNSIATILSYIDDITQWAEGQEPKEPKEIDDYDEDDNDFDDFKDND